MLINNNDKLKYTINKVNIQNITKQKFLVIDVEATGLDIEKDYIIEFACIPVINGRILDKEAFCSFIKSPKPIPSQIERFTGISNQDIVNAPLFKTVITKILDKYAHFIWVAQCGFEFDFPIIENICKKENINFSPKKMDTKVLFAFLYQNLDETFSTDFLKNYFNIDSSDLKRHTALGDVILIARILQKIIKIYEQKKIKDLIIDKPITIKKFVPHRLI